MTRAVLSLPAQLTIYSVGEVRTQCLTWLAGATRSRRKSGASLTWIDAAAVDEVDGAGVQLLIAFSHSLKARQRDMRLLNPSDPLTRACRELGALQLLTETQA